MALQATTIELRDRASQRLGADAFDSYLAELEVTELTAGRVVLSVGATLAREASRRRGPALTDVCRELFGSRRVLLAGDDEWFDLGEGNALGPVPETRTQPKPRASSGSGRVRQRSGPCGQPGTRERLAAQKAFRVPFALAASLPRCASQAFGRHSPQQPLEYVGRWGKAGSEETLSPFHHRLLLGALRLAQAGCATDEGVACSINTLLLAAEGEGTRELGVARDQVLPHLAGLLDANATYTAHHVAEHSADPYIAEERKLERPIIEDVLVRTAEDPQRLVSLSKITVRGEDGRWQQIAKLARGGGASILIVFAGWVLDALPHYSDPMSEVAGSSRLGRLRTCPRWDALSAALVALLAIPEIAVRHNGITGVGFTLAFAVPLLWRSRWPSAVFVVLALIAFVQWLAGVRVLGDVALLGRRRVPRIRVCGAGAATVLRRRCGPQGRWAAVRDRARGGSAAERRSFACLVD